MAMHIEIRGNLAYVAVDSLVEGAPPGTGGLAIYKLGDEPPTADAGPDQVIECAGASGATVSLTGSGIDPEGGALTYAWTGPFGTLQGQSIQPVLSVGVNVISLIVTDAAGNTASDTVQVTVRDTVAPTATLTLSPNLLWPPDHRLVPMEAKLADACTASPTVKLVAIRSNEPDNGVADGDTAEDIQAAAFGTDDRTFLLRAERAGSGTGRVYTVTW